MNSSQQKYDTFTFQQKHTGLERIGRNDIPVGCEPFIQTGEFVPQCNGGTQYSGMR